MTVPSETNRSGPYNGNGFTTVFDYEFKITNENYIKVIKADAAGVETVLTIDADYIVSDVGNPAGGQIALTVPLPTGQTLTMIPNVPFTQEIDLENQGAYYAETVETGLDLATLRDQQLQEQINRAVTIPASEDPAQLEGLVGDILRLADSADNIDMVAGAIGNVNTVAANIASVNTAAANMAAIIDAPAQAAAAAASATLAQAWAANPEDSVVSGGLYSALHYAAKAAAIVATVALPAIPVASSFLQRNVANTAYVAVTPDNARLAMTALKGQDIANFAGANESAKIAAMYAAAPAQPYMYRADSHIGIIRDAAPLNYHSTRSALVVQHRDTAAGAMNELAAGAVFQFNSTGDGWVDAANNLSLSIWQGLVSSMTKTGDGSGSAFTAVVGLGAYGANQYNEGGLFQGEATNLGSLHGTMSGTEVLLKDGSVGTNYNTQMHSVIGRLARYNNGSSAVANFMASSEGTVAPDAAYCLNAGGLHTWKRGVDLKDGIFTTGQAVLLPNNAALAWMSSAAAAKTVMFVSAADEVWITGTGTTAGISLGNSAAAISFRAAGVASAVNFLEASGAIAGGTPLLWARGADADIGMAWATKGAGAHSFYTNGSNFNKQVEIGHVATPTSYISLKGAAAAGHPVIQAAGTEVNPSMIVQGKGTGGVYLKDGAAAVKLQVNTTGIGFFAAAPVAKQAIGAALSQGGAETNTNLATRINEIRTALINYGLAA
ncbi:hypothetical protein [Mesorhizobium sp. M4B.F.Ca.ET.017.02.2.1]|uniref:hypothetical protein n=1 Tax=Mesorhizobium sp. M4B.F.Ca.ET.017.02.2.1 TaxID=2496649 RepID=UPI000FC9AA04|nr:hypothetical protein [Mesorhizobium sp. M4B.F.Ca.ET.017.02.2.1]RVD30184.1 hypothetical protein EN738_07290 [Mesorhizobium sp. M4B.F.Ca.ET.017.02.2.1]